MSSDIILYDLPSKGRCACWSLNPWKARASLNYKGLPHKTDWIEHPDLAPTFKALGIPKTDGSAAYTDYSSPAIRMPDGTFVMDSRKIAEALDKLQPEPSLHTDDNEVIDKTMAAVNATFTPLRAIGMPRVPEMLNPRSAEYFHETRSKRFGLKLEDLAKSDQAGENAWKGAEPGLEQLKEVLNQDPEGPYVIGKHASFSDFVIGGFFDFVKKLDRGDLYDRLMKTDESFPKHWEATKKWFERDDH